METSILRRLRVGMMLFGVAMGVVFPFYASLFVEFRPGRLVWFVMGCIMAGITVGAVSFYLVRRILIEKLKQLADKYREVSAGNLNALCVIKSSDAIGEISDGFNGMLNSLRELIKRISENMEGLSGLSKSLNENARRQQQTVTEHGGHVAQIASSTTEATETQAQISKNLAETAEYSGIITEHARETIDVLTDTVVMADSINDDMKPALKHMEDLQEQAKNIGDIISIISDISDQTKLIAFNADLETFGAGVAGRRFAVVATEIRALAERTAASTGRIQDILLSFDEGVKYSMSSMLALVEAMGTYNEKVSGSTQKVAEILENMEKGLRRINNVHNATSEQVRAFTEIKKAMDNIEYAFMDIKETAEKVASHVEDLNTLIDKQEGSIRQFQL